TINGSSDTINGSSDTINGSSDTINGNIILPAEKIIELLKSNPFMTGTELAQKLGINRRNTVIHLKKLQDAGRIKRVGAKKNGHWEVID
ncbi:MAG: HTH domain-containing protein, partial [Bacteroidales bacterium]|nr:HTH domain-containing protein [Bacteroidales bacterium]